MAEALREGMAGSPWDVIENHLGSARRSILAEIRNYPPPIAACDQQFNHLLEQRDRIARELSRLATLRQESSGGEVDIRRLIEFTNASDCMADAVKSQLVQQLQRAISPTA